MKNFEELFKVTLVRYNHGSVFDINEEWLNRYPTESDLVNFLSDCNEGNPYKDYETHIRVDKIFKPKKT